VGICRAIYDKLAAAEAAEAKAKARLTVCAWNIFFGRTKPSLQSGLAEKCRILVLSSLRLACVKLEGPHITTWN